MVGFEKNLIESNISYLKVKCVKPRLKSEACAVISGAQTLVSIMTSREELANYHGISLMAVVALTLFMYAIFTSVIFKLILGLMHPSSVLITKSGVYVQGQLINEFITAKEMALADNPNDKGLTYIEDSSVLRVYNKMGIVNIYVSDKDKALKDKLQSLFEQEGEGEL